MSKKGILVPALFIVGMIFLLQAGCQPENEQPQSHAISIDTTMVIQKGQEITQAAFLTLSANVKKAIDEGGISRALSYCNVEAMPLTDSLSRNFGVTIRRASHQPRNPGNRADSLEMETIRTYLEQINNQEPLQPVVKTINRQIIYHAPIRIPGELCLNCHGQPGTDITEANLSVIDSLYPGDEAKGFSMGDLRGIWEVQFPETYFENLESGTESDNQQSD